MIYSIIILHSVFYDHVVFSQTITALKTAKLAWYTQAGTKVVKNPIICKLFYIKGLLFFCHYNWVILCGQIVLIRLNAISLLYNRQYDLCRHSSVVMATCL